MSISVSSEKFRRERGTMRECIDAVSRRWSVRRRLAVRQDLQLQRDTAAKTAIALKARPPGFMSTSWFAARSEKRRSLLRHLPVSEVPQVAKDWRDRRGDESESRQCDGGNESGVEKVQS